MKRWLGPLLLVSLGLGSGCPRPSDAPTADAPDPPIDPETRSGAAPAPSEDSPETNTESTEERPPADRSRAGGERCRPASDPVVLGEAEDRRVRAAVAMGDRGGIVAWTGSKETVRVRPIDLQGSPTDDPRDVTMVGARGLRWAFPRREGGAILVTHEVCAETRHLRKCVALRSVDAEGLAVGTTLEHPTGEWITTAHWASGSGELFLLRSHTYAAPALDRFVHDEDGVRHAGTLDLGHGHQEAEESPPVGLALATTPSGVAALVARSEPPMHRYLHRSADDSDGVRIVGPLPGDLGAPEGPTLAARSGAAGFWLTFPLGPRARALVPVGPDGRLGDRETLDGPLPEALGDVVTARIHHGQLVRRDAGGRTLGHAFGGAPTLVDVAWGGRAYVGVSTERRRRVTTVSSRGIRCDRDDTEGAP